MATPANDALEYGLSVLAESTGSQWSFNGVAFDAIDPENLLAVEFQGMGQDDGPSFNFLLVASKSQAAFSIQIPKRGDHVISGGIAYLVASCETTPGSHLFTLKLVSPKQ